MVVSDLIFIMGGDPRFLPTLVEKRAVFPLPRCNTITSTCAQRNDPLVVKKLEVSQNNLVARNIKKIIIYKLN